MDAEEGDWDKDWDMAPKVRLCVKDCTAVSDIGFDAEWLPDLDAEVSDRESVGLMFSVYV